MLGLTSSLNAKESLRVQFANEQSQIIANEKNVQEDLLRIASEGGKIDEEALKASQERQDLAEVTLSENPSIILVETITIKKPS